MQSRKMIKEIKKEHKTILKKSNKGGKKVVTFGEPSEEQKDTKEVLSPAPNPRRRINNIYSPSWEKN